MYIKNEKHEEEEIGEKNIQRILFFFFPNAMKQQVTKWYLCVILQESQSHNCGGTTPNFCERGIIHHK